VDDPVKRPNDQAPQEATPRGWPVGAPARYTSAGLEFILTFGLLTAAGWALDRRLGTLPMLTIAGSAGGFALASYRLIRQGLEIHRRWTQRRPGAGLDEGEPPCGPETGP